MVGGATRSQSGGEKHRRVTLLTLGVSVISSEVTYCKRQKVHIVNLSVSSTAQTLLTTQSPYGIGSSFQLLIQQAMQSLLFFFHAVGFLKTHATQVSSLVELCECYALLTF